MKNVVEIGRKIRIGLYRRLAPIAALLLSIGFTFNGLDNDFGHPLLFLLSGGILALLLIDPPPRQFWVRALPLLLLVTAAYGWATAPLWLPPGFGLAQAYLVPDRLLSQLVGAGGLMAAFLAGALLAARRYMLAGLIDWLVFFACVNIVAGLVLREYSADLPWDFWRTRADLRFTGTLSNANVAGTYFGMAALLALGRITSDSSADDPMAHGVRAARWIGLLLCTCACAITASRSAMTSTALGLGGIALFHGFQRKGRQSLVVLLLLIFGMVAALTVGLADLLLQRLSLVADGTAGRLMMWSHYWKAAMESPWFGYGLGSFSDVNLRALGDPRMAQAIWMVNAPHNLVLRFLIEGGIPFLALLTIGMLQMGRRIAINMAYYGPLDGRAGILAAVFTAIFCSLVDIALDIPALAALTLFLLGLLWERHQFGAKSSSKALTVRQRSIRGT